MGSRRDRRHELAPLTVPPVTMYAGAGEAWRSAAVLAYAPLARHLIDRCPIDIADRRVLDAGSGTGVAAEMLTAHGARVVACDIEMDMLRAMTSRATPRCSPMCARSRSAAMRSTCASSLSSSTTSPIPRVALREMRRVTTSGGPILASVFSTERPRAKSAIDDVLASHGWRAPRCTTSCSGTLRPLGRSSGCGAWPKLRHRRRRDPRGRARRRSRRPGGDRALSLRSGAHRRVRPFVAGISACCARRRCHASGRGDRRTISTVGDRARRDQLSRSGDVAGFAPATPSHPVRTVPTWTFGAHSTNSSTTCSTRIRVRVDRLSVDGPRAPAVAREAGGCVGTPRGLEVGAHRAAARTLAVDDERAVPHDRAVPAARPPGCAHTVGARGHGRLQPPVCRGRRSDRLVTRLLGDPVGW